MQSEEIYFSAQVGINDEAVNLGSSKLESAQVAGKMKGNEVADATIGQLALAHSSMIYALIQ